MNSSPIDTSHPAVRDYLSLVRLQVLTPLSLLINIAAVAVCTFAANPSIIQVSHLHPTSITPKASVIGVYLAVVYLGQIGYCLLLVVARKAETKVSVIHSQTEGTLLMEGCLRERSLKGLGLVLCSLM
jgi:hypothetical protein